MIKDNLKTAQVWFIRENFKILFARENDISYNYNLWKEKALSYEIKPINSVIAMFDSHLKGIINVIKTRPLSAKYENMNGKIQALLLPKHAVFKLP